MPLPRKKALSIGRNKRTWVADFETTTTAEDCRAWGWGLCSVENPENVEFGGDMHSFIERISSESSVTYFHNLGFDGSFILDHLFREGFEFTDEKHVGFKQFQTLISKMGKFYSITVRWENGMLTEFRDSLKKLPMSVRNVAKAFKLAQVKGEIDYHSARPVGWVMTEEEREYVKNDVQIVARALQVQIAEGMTRLTVGADSLAQYKGIMGKDFDRHFPVLSPSIDAEIRRAYRGGWAHVNKRYRGKIVGKGQVFDVNSLYPWVMKDKVLPYGEPVYRSEGIPETSAEYPLFIACITFVAKLKPDHLPVIQIKNSSMFTPTEYVEEVPEPTTMYVTNVDLKLWEDHYDLEILAYNGSWHFQGLRGFFDGYIDHWMEVKENSEGGRRLIAKLHLNSLYGKFATNPDVTPKIPIFDEEQNIVRLIEGPEDKRNPVYTAMGVFITSYARDLTVRTAQDHFDRFIYADTDSLHLLIGTGSGKAFRVHPTELGAWKREYGFKAGLFIRAKAYTELGDENYHADVGCKCDNPSADHFSTHIAGMPESIARNITFDSYRDGATFEGKLAPQRVPGGIVLRDVGFTLNL